MDYDNNEIPSELSKKEGNLGNTLEESLENGMMVSKLVYTSLQIVKPYMLVCEF